MGDIVYRFPNQEVHCAGAHGKENVAPVLEVLQPSGTCSRALADSPHRTNSLLGSVWALYAGTMTRNTSGQPYSFW